MIVRLEAENLAVLASDLMTTDCWKRRAASAAAVEAKERECASL